MDLTSRLQSTFPSFSDLTVSSGPEIAMEGDRQERQGDPATDAMNGDVQDELDMAKMGKKQQFTRDFRFLSILGLSCILTVVWEGVLILLVYGLDNGGPGGLVISYIYTWVGWALVVASLGELMSAWPTSGGQYHWTYTLAPPRMARSLSYVCGYQAVIFWQCAVMSSTFLTSGLLQGLVVLNYPVFRFKRWHAIMIMYALTMMSAVVNTVLRSLLPLLENGALTIHLIGFVVVLTVITTMCPKTATAHDVFQVFYNGGGWPTMGVSFFVGLQGQVFGFLGADGAIHLSEEVQNASIVLPWSLLACIGINGVLGFAMLIAVLFTMGPIQAALNSPMGFPFENAFQYATGSVAGAIGLDAVVVVLALFCMLSQQTSASRQLWAFSRDDGVPCSGWLKRVDPRSKLPLYSLFTCNIVVLLIALIDIGSTVALDAIISLTVMAALGSYILPIGLILYRRIQAVRGLGSDLPWDPFRLGRYSGIVINFFAVTWCILSGFWAFWPAVTPTPAAEMNWACLIYGALLLFELLFWITDGRKRYSGPVRDVDGQIEPVADWVQEVGKAQVRP